MLTLDGNIRQIMLHRAIKQENIYVKTNIFKKTFFLQF